MRRTLPDLSDVPESPTGLRHLKRRREYGKEYRVHLACIIPIMLIELYQKLTVDRTHVCVFFPSCSEYSRLAYIRYGFLAATAVTIERIKWCRQITEWPERNKP